jgi:hypothetical protein
MTEPRHPCAGRSLVQRKAFEAIAINQQANVSLRTIDALLKAGLIEKCGDRVVGRDRFGIISIPVYAVPLPIHFAWCEWCAAQPDTDL